MTTAETPDEALNRAAEAIAAAIGHHQDWDTPEGPCCDGTIPCHHEPEPGCKECAEFGWPCDVALNATRVAIQIQTDEHAGLLALFQYAEAIQGSLSGLNGSDVRNQLREIAEQFACPSRTEAQLCSSLGLCPNGEGHWERDCAGFGCDVEAAAS